MTKEECIALDLEYQKDCTPRQYEYARNGIKTICEHMGDASDTWTHIFEIAIKGLDVAVHTVFPADMFTMDSINVGTEVDTYITSILGYDVHEDGKRFDLTLDEAQMNVISTALSVYKHVGLSYHPNEFKHNIGSVLSGLFSSMSDGENEFAEGFAKGVADTHESN